MACNHAASGCNYPEGDCNGDCLIANVERLIRAKRNAEQAGVQQTADAAITEHLKEKQE